MNSMRKPIPPVAPPVRIVLDGPDWWGLITAINEKAIRRWKLVNKVIELINEDRRKWG